MARWLLDTCILVNALRNPKGAEAERLRRMRPDEVCTSVIVAGELRLGALKAPPVRVADRAANALLDSLEVEPLTAPVDRFYSRLRAHREARGLLMGANDLWIAAHAMALDCVLVTSDKGFSGIEGLTVETWLRGPRTS